ncbi:similar to MFS sugar transporter [Botrytis cinerea T4]|uniref:Similar to MFS sugar transporter n=1 Tax=Botryotinia fuckeliana (strain T4) TaxID=999810 RepID=G2YYW1_BOTF4|nr:similar to MFS sugar transporter [Botrytis cinerea T4]
MSEDIVHSSGGNRYNNIIVIIVSLGSFTYGFCSSIVGSLTGLPAFYDYFDFSNTGAQAGYTSSMLGVGRKVSIQLITTACILAAAFTTGSQNVAMLLSGRALQGIAAGMINVVCPMYHAEVSPVSVRGRMVGTHATFLVIGYAMASWVGLGCYFESTPAIQWRLCLALQMVAPLLLLLCSSWVPESPRWLIYNGREEQSREILRKLHYHIDDPNGILPEREFMDISRQVAADRENERSFFALFKEPSTRIRMIYGFFIIFAAQSSGVLVSERKSAMLLTSTKISKVINNYQFTLYEGLGITGWKALLLFGVYTSWAATMNWVNALLLDRFGRIKVMTFGMLGAVVAISCDTAMVARFAGKK